MEFKNLKRKELQLLCRKHQIPANLTNLEMAERLTALSAVDEKKPLTRGRRPCLKSADDTASGNESDLEVRPAKKVKFSPDNETIEFEKSAVRYSQVDVGRRGKSAMSGDKGSSVVEREPGVPGSGVKVGVKEGKRGKKADASKSSEVVADRSTRQARRRLLAGGRKDSKGVVIEGSGRTSDMTEGCGTKARRGKSFENNAPGIKGKKTAKADNSSEDKALIQNVENADTRPKRGRPKKGRATDGILVASEAVKMAEKIEASKADSSEDKANIYNVENEDTGPKGGRPKKRRTSEVMLVTSETRKMAEKVEASKAISSENKATTQNVGNEDMRPKRGRPKKGTTSEGILVASEAVKMAEKFEASKADSSEDKTTIQNVENDDTRPKRGRPRTRRTSELMLVVSETRKMAEKVEASKADSSEDKATIQNVGNKDMRPKRGRPKKGRTSEGRLVSSETGKMAAKVEASKDKELVDDGLNENAKQVRRSRRGKSPVQIDAQAGNRAIIVEALEDTGLVNGGVTGEVKRVTRSRRGKSPEGMQIESETGNRETKVEALEDGLVDDGATGDVKMVRRSRRGKSPEEMQVDSKPAKMVAKDKALKSKGVVIDGLNEDQKETKSVKGKSFKGSGKELAKDAVIDKGLIDTGLSGDAKDVRQSRRGKSAPGMQSERMTENKGIVVGDGLNGDAKDVRSSRRGKSPEATKAKRVTMADSIKGKGLVDGFSGDARKGRRISRRRNFTASSGVSEGKPSTIGDVPSTNIQNDEHTVVKKPLLSKREAAIVEREQNGSLRKHSKKSSNVTNKEDSETASGSKEAVMEVADVQISGADTSKIVDVNECSPAESKLRRSQRSASKLELSVQSSAAVIIRNTKMETRNKGGAVLGFETHATQESNSNRRLSKKIALSTGKGEIPMPAAETKKSAEVEEIRSMGNTEAENTSNVDIAADLKAQAVSIEGPTKINIEDTSNVDFPLDLDAQAILAEDSMGRNIEVEGADFDTQAALAENPATFNIEVVDTSNVDISTSLHAQAASAENAEVVDTSNVDIPADLHAQAASVGGLDDTSIVEIDDISNVDIRADIDAEAAAKEAQTDSICDNGIDAQLSANLPQFETESNSLIGQPLTREENSEGNDYLATHVRTPLTDGNSALVIDESVTQQEKGVLENINFEDHDSQTKNIRTPSKSENDCVDSDLELTNDLDKHHETAIESTSEAHSCEGIKSQTKHIKTEKDCGDGNMELGVDYLDKQHGSVLKGINSEAHSNEGRYDGNDSQIPLIAEKDCVKQREEVSPIKKQDCGAHYSSTMLANFHQPDTSSFEDTKTDEIDNSKIAVENSEKLLEHKSPEAIGRSASQILLDGDVSCCVDFAHSSGMRGNMLYYTEPSAEDVETETKFSGGVFDSMESVQTSPSLGLNGEAAGEASKAVDLETHFVMSAQSPSDRGVQPNLDQGVHAAKSNEYEDFGHLKSQDNDLEFSLESHEENSPYYKSTSDARTNICDTQDQVEEPIAACDTQSVAFSPVGEGTQIFDGGEGYGVCNEAKIIEGSVSVEAVYMTNTPSSGGDAEIVKGTVSMNRSLDVEANALDDQPALSMEGEASCLKENNERKDSKTTYMRAPPLTPEEDHMYDEYDNQHAAVGENTISEVRCISPCEVNEEVMLQNSEGTERMQPNLEALKHMELKNSEILIDAYDVGSSYSVNDGQAKAIQTQTILNTNESKQDDDNTMLVQSAEVLSTQMNSCGMSAALENYEHLEIDSFEDLKSIECDSSKTVIKNSLETVGRSTSINELQGDINNGENSMQGEVLSFNEPSVKCVGIVSEFSGIADDSGTESFRNSYSFDWDGFDADIDAGVHGMRSDDQSCASQPELDQGLLETAAGSILETEAHQCTGNADEGPDHNSVSNYKSDSTTGNTLGGAESETISSAAKHVQKSKNARSILIHGTPRRQPATAHPKENASISKVGKAGSLTSVRTTKPPPSARRPWK